jgi:hypothetical protein
MLKMKRIRQLFFAIMLLSCWSAYGQLTTTFSPASTPSAAIGTGVSLQLRVTGFTNIASLQMPITYNSAILRFDSIDFSLLPGYGDTTLASHPTAGKIVVTWFPNPSQYPQGVTLAGNTSVFTLRFTVLSAGTATVNLANVAPGVEVINSLGNNVTVSFQGNGATVVGTSGGGGGGGGGVTCSPTGNPPAADTYTGFKIIANTAFIPQGQYGCLPITVNSFDNILTLLFALHWDPAVLQFDCTKAHNLPDLATKIINPSPNTLVVGWDDPSASGVSRSNGAKLFDVCFRAIGNPNTQSLIWIDGIGLPPSVGTTPEAYNAASQNIWSVASTPVRDTAFVVDPANTGCGVVFKADRDSVDQNAQACVDVKVDNFFWMNNSEFTLTFDPTKLTYQNIQLGSNPLNLSTSGAGANLTVNSGQVRFSWNSAAANGLTIPNNTTIFSVCFTAIGAPGSVSNVNFSSSPCTPITATRKNIGGIPMKLDAGSVTVKVPTVNATINVVDANCSGAPATITVTPSGGSATGYSWSGPNNYTSNVQNPTNITTGGTYTLTVTFTGGVTVVKTAVVTPPVAISLPAGTTTTTGVSCFGGNNGSATINPTGGTAPYMYQWAGPAGFSSGSKNISSLVTGNYVVTITDSKSCTFVSTPINVPTPSPLTIQSSQVLVNQIKCAGGSDGSITVNPSGGTSPYSVSWTGPAGYNAIGQSITGLVEGSYVPSVTDSKGCTFVGQPVTLTPPTPIALSLLSIQDIQCFGTVTGGATIGISGGASPFTYVWRNTSTGILASMLQNPTNFSPGTYNVTVTDANTCTKTLSIPVTISSPASALMVTASTTPASCLGNGSINLTISGGWPGVPVVSYSGGPVSLPGQPSVTMVPGGTYNYSVTDIKGCNVTGTVTVGGTPAITIGSPQVTNLLCAGSGNGCISILPAGGSNAPYFVTWSNTTLTGSTICGLSGGNYAPTVTDNAGCTAAFPAILVTEPPPIVIMSTSTQQTGTMNNGTIDLTVSGGTGNLSAFTYFWIGPSGYTATTQDLSGLAAGNYTVTVRDANNCAQTSVVTVTQDNIMLASSVTGVTNACNDDGCIKLSLPGGAPAPFTITWTGGSPLVVSQYNPQVCGLKPGVYAVTVTSSNGFSVVLSATIVQLERAIVSTSSQPPNGASMNGSISLTPVFSSPYTFLWSNGFTGSFLNNLDSGTYKVTITNTVSGCTEVKTFVLARFYPPLVTSITSQKSPTCINSANGEIYLTVDGGALPYQYKWQGPGGFMSTNRDLTGLVPGSYQLTVTDATGGTKTVSVTLNALSNLSITNVNELSVCNGFQLCGASSCDGIANVVFSGQLGNVNILWSNGVTTVSNSSLCAGAYSVSVTDGLGCVSVWSDMLTAPPPLLAAVSLPTLPRCAGDCNGVARVGVSGGVAPYVVNWSTNQVDNLSGSSMFSQATGLCGATYMVTVSDGNGITTTSLVVVPDAPEIELVFTAISPNTFNSCDGEVAVTPEGTTGNVVVTWSGGFGHSGTGQRAENLCAGEPVSFIVTDANGCIATGFDTVPYPIDGCLKVRPVITPGDEDGNNDFLLITCVESVPNTVQLFNRWGQLVFETTGYHNISNNFNGNSKFGRPLAEGVYYYILTYTNVDGFEIQEKGHFNLLR